MKDIGFVIGNGSSREDFDLRKLNYTGPSYGTNAIHRDFFTGSLFCTKRKHLVEALSWGLQTRLDLYSTLELIQLVKDPEVKMVPKLPFKPNHTNEMLNVWTSGSYALLLAAQQHDIVVCLGMDYEGESIYHDTDSYWEDVRTDYTNGLQQSLRVINYYNETQFIFISDTPTNTTTFENATNVTYDNYKNFQDILLT